jgi:hypothetical protein
MPVPMPDSKVLDLSRPGAEEAQIVARGVAAAVRCGTELTPLQSALLRAELKMPTKAFDSPGPWQAGGITEHQLIAARSRADADGYEYVPWTPDPSR